MKSHLMQFSVSKVHHLDFSLLCRHDIFSKDVLPHFVKRNFLFPNALYNKVQHDQIATIWYKSIAWGNIICNRYFKFYLNCSSRPEHLLRKYCYTSKCDFYLGSIPIYLTIKLNYTVNIFLFCLMRQMSTFFFRFVERVNNI
jgi:hypothetical protein